MHVWRVLLSLAAASAAALVLAAGDDVIVTIATDRAVHRVRDTFLSTTIDVSLLFHDEHCDLTSPRLVSAGTTRPWFTAIAFRSLAFAWHGGAWGHGVPCGAMHNVPALAVVPPAIRVRRRGLHCQHHCRAASVCVVSATYTIPFES